MFGALFPAVTGIIAGTNSSGDLKDPATAIPKGTLLAILTSFITYIGYGIMIGAFSVPNALAMKQNMKLGDMALAENLKIFP